MNVHTATKLMIGSTVGMLVVLAVHASVTFRRERALLESDSRHEGERLAQVMAMAVARDWDQLDREKAVAMLKEIDQRDPEVQFRWIEPQRAASIVGTDARAQQRRPVSRTAAGRMRLHSYVVVPAPEGSEGQRGWVEVVQSLVQEQTHVRHSMLYLALAVLVILMFNALLATVLSRVWVAKPVAKLLAMATDVGGGDLDKRVALSNSAGGEFVQLGDALNEMGERLAESRAKRELEQERRIQTEAQLRHAERLTTVGKLAAGVAHEIGTPLNVITGHANMIVRGQVEGDGAVQGARTITAHADRITKIVTQLLGFARRSGPEPTETDLSKLCRDTMVMLRSLAKKQQVDMVLPATEPHVAHVDANQIRQVLSNLVTNAVQAMPDGGRVSVAVATEDASPPPGVDAQPGSYVRISVQDTGNGMTKDQQAHIFEPFYTTKDVGEGTGLGLSIAHGIAVEHGGWIEVESELGKGSTFTLFLPNDPT